jgi:uncharacterized DUF497 family protein
VTDFEWDDEKEAANRAKHGVAFTEAALAFNDETALERFDDAHSEPRWVMVARVPGTLVVLVVAYTERNDVIRLISARPATPHEEAAYFNQHG